MNKITQIFVLLIIQLETRLSTNTHTPLVVFYIFFFVCKGAVLFCNTFFVSRRLCALCCPAAAIYYLCKFCVCLFRKRRFGKIDQREERANEKSFSFLL